MEEQVEGTSTVVEIKDPAAVLAALERAKGDAKRFREEKEMTEKEFSEFKSKAEILKAKLKQDQVIDNLKRSGIKNGEALLKYIKMSEIELTDEYEIAGLETQLDILKEDFPELFNPKKIVGGKADAGIADIIENNPDASELQARMILGRLYN